MTSCHSQRSTQNICYFLVNYNILPLFNKDSSNMHNVHTHEQKTKDCLGPQISLGERGETRVLQASRLIPRDQAVWEKNPGLIRSPPFSPLEASGHRQHTSCSPRGWSGNLHCQMQGVNSTQGLFQQVLLAKTPKPHSPAKPLPVMKITLGTHSSC